MKIGVFYRVVLLVHLPKENPFRIVGGCKICDNTGALAITTRIAEKDVVKQCVQTEI